MVNRRPIKILPERPIETVLVNIGNQNSSIPSKHWNSHRHNQSVKIALTATLSVIKVHNLLFFSKISNIKIKYFDIVKDKSKKE